MVHLVSTRTNLSNERALTKYTKADTSWCLVPTVFKLFLVWLLQTHIPSSVPCMVMLMQIIFRNVCQQGLRGFQSKIVSQEVWRKRLKLSRMLDVPTVRFLLGLILQKWYVRRWKVKQIHRVIFHNSSVCCQLFFLRVCICIHGMYLQLRCWLLVIDCRG
jgi:hypothetical protein